MSDESELAENEESPSAAAYQVPVGVTISTSQKPKWRWDVLGDNYTVVVNTTRDISWWHRTITRLMFGSKWKKLNS